MASLRGCVASDEGEAARGASGSRSGEDDDWRDGCSSTAPKSPSNLMFVGAAIQYTEPMADEWPFSGRKTLRK